MAKTTKKDSSYTPKKTECAVTRAQFEQAAKPLLITINGANMPSGEDDQGKTVTMPKKFAVGVYRNKETGDIGFASGSLGWNISDKMDMEIDGVPVKVQVGINITIVNSKEAQ